jgi:hypothetical protein
MLSTPSRNNGDVLKGALRVYPWPFSEIYRKIHFSNIHQQMHRSFYAQKELE